VRRPSTDSADGPPFHRGVGFVDQEVLSGCKRQSPVSVVRGRVGGFGRHPPVGLLGDDRRFGGDRSEQGVAMRDRTCSEAAERGVQVGIGDNDRRGEVVARC
jgi:hypothetical protein